MSFIAVVHVKDTCFIPNPTMRKHIPFQSLINTNKTTEVAMSRAEKRWEESPITGEFARLSARKITSPILTQMCFILFLNNKEMGSQDILMNKDS